MIGAGFDPTDSMPLEDAIKLSIMTPRGSYWQRPEFGSDLHTLDRITADTPKQAEGIVQRSLNWMVKLDRLRDLKVVATVPRPSTLLIKTDAKGINGQPLSLSMFVPVGVVP